MIVVERRGEECGVGSAIEGSRYVGVEDAGKKRIKVETQRQQCARPRNVGPCGGSCMLIGEAVPILKHDCTRQTMASLLSAPAGWRCCSQVAAGSCPALGEANPGTDQQDDLSG